MNRRLRPAAVALAGVILASGVARSQTDEQSEESIAYLKSRACMEWDGAAWLPDANPVTICQSDDDCQFPSFCKHLSLAVPKSELYPKLRFPNAPTEVGFGEAYLRYVPLCEDGSGDHEYSLSEGIAGTPPTCDAAAFIRCSDGGRPYYRADAGEDNNWLIHAGAGGHASSPNVSESPIWALTHTQDQGSYSVSATPKTLRDIAGIFDEAAPNPFSSYNRIWVEKCTPDRWLGNRAHHDLQDFVEPVTLEFVVGPCVDANGDGTANCRDNLDDPDACECDTRKLDPPPSPNHEYSVYYHGKRIVRAVVADILGGITTYREFPSEIEDVFVVPDSTSKILFHCHSNGCNGLQGGHIDDLHSGIDALVGADVDVRALFTGSLDGSVEAEITASEYDCVDDSPADGIPDNEAEIDDLLSLYDHVIDTRSITLQKMSKVTYEPGPLSGELQLLEDYWDSSASGYSEPVDASCLATHCPGSTLGWAEDPDCAPCNESRHVLLNHLQTPFLYNQAQRDNTLGKSMRHCESGTEPPLAAQCDVAGAATGINMLDTHWRKLVRKMIADLFRSAELERCEGGVGSEWPYNHIMLLSPDWTNHSPLSEPDVATKLLDLPGAGGAQQIAQWAHDFVHLSSPAAPIKAVCLVERTAGENASDFDDPAKGTVDVCTE